MASPPSAGATLHPSFGAIGEARQAAISARSTVFRRTHPRSLLRASVARWGGIHQVLPTRGDCLPKELSSEKCRTPYQKSDAEPQRLSWHGPSSSVLSARGS